MLSHDGNCGVGSVQYVFSGTARALRCAGPGLLGLALCGMLWADARALDWSAVAGAFGGIPAWRWAAAALATALSFMAIAQYDVLAHRHLRTNAPEGPARRAGAAAVALGQTTGFGPVVGGAVRWQLMPGIKHTRIIGLTGFVTFSFLAAWSLVALTLALPVLSDMVWLALPAFVCGALGVMAVLIRVPRMTLLGKGIDLPSVPGMARMTLLAGADMALAALALYLLLPPGIAPSLSWLVAAYTLALGAGLVGATPGGIGPFDVTLMTLLPAGAAPEVAAGLLAFRIVYYMAPCLLAACYVLLAKPCRFACSGADSGAVSGTVSGTEPAPLSGPRAEMAIAAQTDNRPIVRGTATATALRTPQSLVLFLGPVTGRIRPLLPALRVAAHQENRLACLYKLTARDSVRVRRAGWCVAAVAVEAVLYPQRHSLSGPKHRQLRRFLRKADSAHIQIRRLTSPDWQELRHIHLAWESRHGRERGLTMGRFCPLYLGDKPLYGAYQDGRLIAYASWLRAPGVLSLDLMRHRPDMPTGTMHALIQRVITDARQIGLQEVNLAALPHPALPDRLSDAAGLARFKRSFAPHWRPLYIAAPSQAALALAAMDVRRAILHPAPLPRQTADLWALDALADQSAPAPLPQQIRKAG